MPNPARQYIFGVAVGSFQYDIVVTRFSFASNEVRARSPLPPPELRRVARPVAPGANT